MVLDKELKVFITGKMETYNMQTRPKYTTGKAVRNINFAAEALSQIKRLEYFMAQPNKSKRNTKK
jgi:hypothetical protein